MLPPSLILFWLLLFYRKNAGAPIAVEGRNLQSPTFWEFARWIIDGGGSSWYFAITRCQIFPGIFDTACQKKGFLWYLINDILRWDGSSLEPLLHPLQPLPYEIHCSYKVRDCFVDIWKRSITKVLGTKYTAIIKWEVLLLDIWKRAITKWQEQAWTFGHRGENVPL